jgi:hypothetical protein
MEQEITSPALAQIIAATLDAQDFIAAIFDGGLE